MTKKLLADNSHKNEKIFHNLDPIIELSALDDAEEQGGHKIGKDNFDFQNTLKNLNNEDDYWMTD